MPAVRKVDPAFRSAIRVDDAALIARRDDPVTPRVIDNSQGLRADFLNRRGSHRTCHRYHRQSQGGRGSSGVSAVVRSTEGSIGYVDIAYALANKLQVAAVKNAAGKYVTPGLKQIAAAASTIKSVPSGNELHIVNPSAKNSAAYPICTFTYVIVPTKSDKAADLRKMVFWALTKGQSFGPKLLFVPVPKVVLAASEKTLQQVQS